MSILYYFVYTFIYLYEDLVLVHRLLVNNVFLFNFFAAITCIKNSILYQYLCEVLFSFNFAVIFFAKNVEEQKLTACNALPNANERIQIPRILVI